MGALPYHLKEIIAEDFHTDFDSSKKAYLLCETKENLSVTIKINKTDNVFCFSLDKDRDRKFTGDSVFPFFNPKVKDLCVKNDFILVCQRGDQVQVLLIELIILTQFQNLLLK